MPSHFLFQRESPEEASIFEGKGEDEMGNLILNPSTTYIVDRLLMFSIVKD